MSMTTACLRVWVYVSHVGAKGATQERMDCAIGRRGVAAAWWGSVLFKKITCISGSSPIAIQRKLVDVAT
jgi:hypothetical protein